MNYILECEEQHTLMWFEYNRNSNPIKPGRWVSIFVTGAETDKGIVLPPFQAFFFGTRFKKIVFSELNQVKYSKRENKVREVREVNVKERIK